MTLISPFLNVETFAGDSGTPSSWQIRAASAGCALPVNTRNGDDLSSDVVAAAIFLLKKTNEAVRVRHWECEYGALERRRGGSYQLTMP